MINTCVRPLLICTAFIVTLFATCSDGQDRVKYAVPEPKIEAFAQGFRVSIPDQEGINLFAFHGNLNVPMDVLEAGQYSKDILKKKDNHWIYEDTETTLVVGDVIYYWLFVIRFNLGYRYDNGHFVVKEIVSRKSLLADSKPPSHNSDSSTNWFFEPLDKLIPAIGSNQDSSKRNSTSQTSLTIPSSTDRKPVSTCCQLFLNVTKQMSILSEHIDRLTEENKLLSDIAEKDDHYSRTLRIFGKYSTEYYPTPQEFVQSIMSEKLKLVGIKVSDAKKISDNGISFKVETLKDKIKVILAAQGNLEGSNYEITY